MHAGEHYGGGEAHCEAGTYRGAMAYFGSIGRPPDPTTFPLVNTRLPKQWMAGAARTRLWRVVSTVLEVQRVATQPPLLPLAEGIVARDGTPRTLLKLRISVSNMGFNPRDFVIDAGGSLELWGETVTIDPIAPAGVAIVGALSSVDVADAVVIDGSLGVQIIGIEAPLGEKAIYTDYRAIAATAFASLPIPRGARDVTIYQGPTGAASVEWTWSYGNPASIAPVWALGQLPFIAGQRRTDTISIPPGATHLVSDVAALDGRFFTIAWTIQP